MGKMTTSKAEKAASLTLQAYKIFHTKNGEKVLTDLAKECGLFVPSSSLDPQALAFREGQREVVHKLLTLSNMKMADLHKLFVNDYRNNSQGED
tara:strand:+ start:771 stop:1052 length:282 start_codon:yes stop_codon:yes gene_type:complete